VNILDIEVEESLRMDMRPAREVRGAAGDGAVFAPGEHRTAAEFRAVVVTIHEPRRSGGSGAVERPGRQNAGPKTAA
jgi:hypothetical protein